MGMDSEARLRVRALNSKAKKRVKAIDLSEYNLYGGWFEDGDLLCCDDDNLAAGRNDFLGLIERIGEALNGEGLAYLVESVEEDVPYAFTFCYQGGKVHVIRFSAELYSFDNVPVLLNVCQGLEPDERKAIYSEIEGEDDDDEEEYDGGLEPAKSLGYDLTCLDFYAFTTQKKISPLMEKLIEKIKEVSGSSEFLQEGFEADIHWQDDIFIPACRFFSKDELKKLEHEETCFRYELDEEDDDEDEIDYEDLASYLNDCGLSYMDDFEGKPHLEAFVNKCKIALSACRYQHKNFIPALEWEEKCIATFTSKERELLGEYPWEQYDEDDEFEYDEDDEDED